MVDVTINKMKRLLLFSILFFSFQQALWSADIINEVLVAKPHMKDTRFKETVIMMIYDNQKGAAGLVVNKPLETISINTLFIGSKITPPKDMINKEITLYWGGPVNPENIFFIHSSDYKSKNFILSNEHFTITREPKVLFDIAGNKGPKKYMILSGISVWQPGQLDFEMVRDDWKKKFNNYIHIFDNGEEMWSRLINSQEI